MNDDERTAEKVIDGVIKPDIEFRNDRRTKAIAALGNSRVYISCLLILVIILSLYVAFIHEEKVVSVWNSMSLWMQLEEVDIADLLMTNQ